MGEEAPSAGAETSSPAQPLAWWRRAILVGLVVVVSAAALALLAGVWLVRHPRLLALLLGTLVLVLVGVFRLRV